MTLSRVLTLALAPAAIVATAPAAQAQTGLAAVQAHLRAVTSMTAQFTQIDRRNRTVTGTMSLKRPGKVRFEYRGVRMTIWGDGSRLNYYDADVDQRQSWPIAGSPLAVLLDPSRDLSRFATVIRDDAAVLMIEARDPAHREFGRITLSFSKQQGAPGGLILQGWNALDAQNNLTRFILTGQRFNVPVAESLFHYQPPASRGPRR